VRRANRTQRRKAPAPRKHEAPEGSVAISPLEGPLGVQPASSNGSGSQRRLPQARVVRRVGQSMFETSESGDEIVLSDTARALADALEAKYREDGPDGN
jgi:hypothetical protein